MHRLMLIACLIGVAAPALAAGPEKSPRPEARVQLPGMDDWLVGFRARALEQGISAKVLDRALAGVRYDEDIIRRDRNQAEFTKTVWNYLDTAVSDLRIANGRKAQARLKGRWTRSRLSTAWSRRSWWRSGGWRAPMAPFAGRSIS